MCDFLQAIAFRDIRKLVINVPPGHMKSLTVDVFFPSWVWIYDPAHRFLSVAYEAAIPIRDSHHILRICQTPEYRAAWPHVKLDTDGSKFSVTDFWTSEKGRRYSVSIRQRITGEHFHTAIIDDPIKPPLNTAPDPQMLQHVEEWYKTTLPTRRADPSTFAQVCIMQRLHERDLSAIMLDDAAEHLCLPAYYEPKCTWDRGNSIGFVDPRTEPGEILFPQHQDAGALEDQAKTMGKANVDAQFQQNPTPASGGIVEEDWLSYEWIELPETCRFIQSWDLGFKGTKASHSYVHGALWCIGIFREARRLLNTIDDRKKGHEAFECIPLSAEPRAALVSEIRGHWNYPQAKAVFRKAQERDLWDRATKIVIENKANGIALIDELHEATRARVIVEEPEGSKEYRMSIQSDKLETGLVLLPSRKRCATVDDYRSEMVKFPRGAHDDRVDTTSQVLKHIFTKGMRRLEQLKNMRP